MTERINHAAEALNFLGAVVIDTHGDDDRKAAIAQVHASLAIAEQLRVANIIALGGDVWEVSEAIHAVLDITPADPELNKGQVLNGLQPEIKAVLGL